MRSIFFMILLVGSFFSSRAQDLGAYEHQMQAAWVAHEMGNSDSALAMLESIYSELESKDDSARLYVRLLQSEIAMDQGNCLKSVLYIQWIIANKHLAAIEGGPMDDANLSGAYNLLGLNQKCLGQLEQARLSFKQAIRLDPSTAFLYSNLAGTYMLIEEYDSADRWISLIPDEELSSVTTAIAYKAEIMMQRDPAEALNWIMPYLGADEGLLANKQINLVMGKLHGKLGLNEEACRYIKAAEDPEAIKIKHHPDNGDFMLEELMKDLLEVATLKSKYCK